MSFRDFMIWLKLIIVLLINVYYSFNTLIVINHVVNVYLSVDPIFAAT